MDVDFDVRCKGTGGGLYGQLPLESPRSGVTIEAVDMSALSPSPGSRSACGVAVDAERFPLSSNSSIPVVDGTWQIVQD